MAQQSQPGQGRKGADQKGDAHKDLHVGMMGDGTEEQNLNQKGDPSARITEREVKDAFKDQGGKGKH